MNFKNLLIIGSLLAFYTSCTPSSVDPVPDVIIEDPVAVQLIFPEDNTECNEGTILNDTESKVLFRWNASDHTDSYEVVLKDLESSTSSIIEASTISKEITIKRGVSYEWSVISKSVESSITATSETFEFFNAAPRVVSHAPFSAEAIAPENNAEISATSGKATLKWEASDIDNDIKDYEIFFGTDENQLVNQGIQITTSLEVDVISGTTCFWMIRTQDETKNISTSEVFSFSVQ